jgi:[ribosomal protein S5]-alanine N-acetyltransferase
MEQITQRLRIREFVVGDFTALRDMDSRLEMHTYERDLPAETDTRNSLDEYIRDQSETPRTSFRFAITIPPQDTVMGIMKISRQWEAIREWEIGWAVHPAEWGRGYAVEAARKIIDWAFNELNVHRVVAFCHADNAASVRVMEKLGMHQDGRLRETRWLRGQWWDEYVYSILEREWRNSLHLSDI